MENPKPKSGSQVLHELLSDKPIGHRFTLADLEEQVSDMGFGLGVVSGFLVRAKKKGMISVVGSTKGKGKRPALVYELIEVVDWNFHGPGIGSVAGREINRQTEPTPPLIEYDENGEPERVLMEYDDGSLSDHLINLAIKINELENRKEKQLCDFSTDEIIEELKRRTK